MRKLSTIAILASTSAFAYQVIEVKPGDTLSSILHKNNLGPLWGKKNYVENSLKINRLNWDSTKTLKPGDLVIIPKEANTETTKIEKQYITQNTETIIYDEVKNSNAAISQTGLMGGLISRHQTVKLNFDYFQRVYNFKEANVKLSENFGVGVSVKSENKYPVSQLSFDPEIYAQVQTQNGARFSEDTNLAANFQPNWLVGFKGHFKNDNMPFGFYALGTVEEISSVDLDQNQNYFVRRDQISSIGLGFSKNVIMNDTSVDILADMTTSLSSRNFNDTDSMNIFKGNLFVNVQLTKDYYLGGGIESYQYTNSEVENSSTYGTKLTYKF